MAESSPPRPSSFRVGSLRGFLPLSDVESPVSTRGQKLSSLIQNRSSTNAKDLRAYLTHRRSAYPEVNPDLGHDPERNADGVLTSTSALKDRLAKERKLSLLSNGGEVLMTPQMRSMRLIGNSNPLYQWERYHKSDEELKCMKKPIREYYERNNHLISSYLYIDKLLDSSLPHNLIQEYQHNHPFDPETPRPPSEDSITSPADEAHPSADVRSTANGHSTTVKVKRTPKALYKLPNEDTPLLGDDMADGPKAQEIHGGEDDEYNETGSKVVTVAIYINLAANAILLAGKIAVIVLTSSLSVLASLVDAALDFLSTAIVWTTTQLISRQDQYSYPVGRRRLEPIGVLVFSVIMIVSFFQVFLKCLNRLTSPDQSIVQLGLPAIIIMASTVVLKLGCTLSLRCLVTYVVVNGVLHA